MVRFVLFLVFFPLAAFSQQVGESTFTSSQIPISTLSSAMGGSQIATFKSDIAQLADNPAFLDSTMTGSASLSYLNYLADINQAGLSYGHLIDSIGFISGYLRYFNFGQFTETDEVGQELGEFSVTDYELGVSLTRAFKNRISYGVTFKQLFSHAYRSTAYGLGADFGAFYHSSDNSFSAGAVIDNLGIQLYDYAGNNLSFLPIRTSIAVSKKFAKAPIRIGFQYNHLETWDLASTDVDALENLEVDPVTREASRRVFTVDNFLRHIAASVVLEPSERFNVFVGYNFRRRLELSTPEGGNLVGFSLGAMIQVKRFGIHYTYSNYHLGTGTNHLALVTNINEWR